MSKPSFDMQRRSILEPALSELANDNAGAPVALREKPFHGRMHLRALEPLTKLNAALEKTLGAKLSNAPNTVTRGKGLDVFWLREGQWLVVTSPKTHEQVFKKIDAALAEMDSSVVDNTDGFTTLELSGAMVRDTIMKGCPLDIHPKVFKKGAMAQTRIVHADVLLHRADTDIYEIHVRNSFAEYMLRWLHDAALEYGIHLIQGEDT